MAKGKNNPKKKNFMDELEQPNDSTEENEEGEELMKKEEINKEEINSPEQPIKNRKGLSSIPGSLKRMRKILDEIDTENISPADKLDLRTADMYIEFLVTTIKNILEELN